ncbi:hypothetical protein [Algiphilus sp.]|uniref:hypothetical protein n=2 Tax=Algiphilus sp. TaxID=1872431 RepID=UPI0025BFB25A|nr:hypothetical protein [Algiphilus sp.]MCK5771261.1 hypothetical protein [Algiphilus sp.]
MIRMSIRGAIASALLALVALGSAHAGPVTVVAAEFHDAGDGRWTVLVTLRHADTGWDHYADNWRVVDGAGNVLGERVLHHPHVEEQPFTRGLRDVHVPEDVSTVYVVARDTVHGWSEHRLAVDLTMARDGHLRVEAD